MYISEELKIKICCNINKSPSQQLEYSKRRNFKDLEGFLTYIIFLWYISRDISGFI
jgi:hypothetical protein